MLIIRTFKEINELMILFSRRNLHYSDYKWSVYNQNDPRVNGKPDTTPFTKDEGNIGEAEDVLQEAFLDAFNKLKDFRQETTFGLWLKQIVVNRSINLLRKRKLELIELEGDHLENIPEEENEDEEGVQYQVAMVKEAMKQLPDGYRVVLSLYLLEGYDHEEISQILNISENTSRTQFLRAKRKLMEILKRKGTVS
jgi:RNA polymerase sigma factor (sigma-70 family)